MFTIVARSLLFNNGQLACSFSHMVALKTHGEVPAVLVTNTHYNEITCRSLQIRELYYFLPRESPFHICSQYINLGPYQLLFQQLV